MLTSLIITSGHLLAPYKLRLSDRGFMMKQKVQKHDFNEVSQFKNNKIIFAV